MESDWRPTLDAVAARKRDAEAMGGPAKVERQRTAGKLTARERMAGLFDGAVFTEIGARADNGDPGAPADGFVAGFGVVNGRPVLAGAEDFTVMGGSIGVVSADKRYRLCQLALQERVPLVMMLEGGGHRLTNAHAGRRPNDLQALASLAGVVPTVALVLGPSAGHGALTAPLCDFVVMSRAGSLFTAGPGLVEEAIGEKVTTEELGGPDLHTASSGVAHNVAGDDRGALDLARRYLAYFPQNAWEHPPVRDSDDTSPRSVDRLLDIVPPEPRRPYPMLEVLDVLVDHGTLLEVQPSFGGSIRTALGCLGGQAVALVANDPSVKAGTIDRDAADKATHFLEVAGAFHLPVVFLADNPGVMAGTHAERAGALRAAARLFAAQHRLEVPKLHVTLRKAYGFGSSIMAMNPFDGQTFSVAFPGASVGAMPASSGARAAKLDDETTVRIAAAQADAAFGLAARLAYDDVIDPRETRNVLLAGLRLAAGRRSSPPAPVAHRGFLP